MDKFMKIMLSIIALIFIVGVVIQFASAAEPTHQYVKQYMDPLYRESMVADTNYSYTLTLDTPDGITEVVSAMLTMQVWHNPTVNYYVWVNGQVCNTPTFQVHTTYANAGEGTIYFDCSNVITGEGTYDVEFQTDDDTGSSTFWADITYSNRPMGTVEVHGTEYTPGQRAKLWVQLLDATGDDVEDGACQIDIYTPVNTVLIENGAMTNLEHDGIYYYDLIAPQSHGVYPAIAKCYYDITETNELADGFTLNTGVVDDKTYIATHEVGGDRHKIEQLAGVVDIEYNFDNMCGLTAAEVLLTGVTVTTLVKWKDSPVNDDVIVSVYNHTSSTWIDLPNEIISPNDLTTVSNFLDTNNITRDGYVDGSGTLNLRLRDTLTSGANEKLEVDFLEITCNEFSDPIWTEVKGSSEMHISGDYRWTTQIESGTIFNATWPGEFHYNVTLSSQTAQTEEDEHIFVELPTPFPCHHVLSLSIDGVDTPFEGHDPVTPEIAGCSVEWDQTLDASTNYDIQIISENYFKQVESTWITESAFDQSMIQLACKNYQVANGLANFTIPQTTPPEVTYADDEFMAVCSDYLDTYYHWNYTYWNEFRTDTGTFTETDMHALNEQWRHLQILTSRLQQEATNILGGLTTGGMYSGAIISNPTGQPIPTWATYWANASMPFINYVTLSTMAATTNPSTIANSVWNYQGTINNTVISQFTSAIWSYTTRTLTAFGLWEHETASDYVWNNTNKTLTSTPFDPSAIANATWAWDARYTHGVDLT